MGKNAITVLQEGLKILGQFNAELDKTNSTILAINDAALKNKKTDLFMVKAPKEVNDALKTHKVTIDGINQVLKERERLEKAVQNQLVKNSQAQTSNAKSLALARYEQTQLNQKNKEAAVLSSKLSTEYQKQSVRLNQLRKQYKDVALTQGESSKAAKNLLMQVTALDNRLKGVDANVGQFQRSVGNYGKAMSFASNAARQLAGAMGLMGGAFLIVNTIKDAFNRVREFDKAMQNMVGIMRVTRVDAKDLEEAIIKVSGASTKTAAEVAGLATSLVTLGKTKSEVIDMLQPVNDLAIGLETTSEAAAEFLVQTLNAFGAGSSEALKYADTLASIANFTTLDFQKMSDSFQYLTPISNILGKDLAYTGSVLGILADNGIKAESAGRLLGTAQSSLAKEGKSLADGLEVINKAYREGKRDIDLLAAAGGAFDAQSIKIGVVLSQNTDKIEKNAQAIRDNGGALEDLVNEQLKSVDASLKILDASWESLILTIENGDGTIANSFKEFISFLTTAINKTKELEQAQGGVFKTTGKESENWFIRNILGLGLLKTSYDKLVDTQKEFNRTNENLGSNGLPVLQRMYKDLETTIETNNDLTIDQEKLYQAQLVTIQEAINAKKEERKAIEDTAIALGFNAIELGKYADKISDYTDGDLEDFIKANKALQDATNSKDNANVKSIASLKELIKLERDNIEVIDIEVAGNDKIIKHKQKLIEGYQKEIDAILGLNKARETTIKAVVGSLAYMEQEVSRLKEKQSKLATTTKEYYLQEKAIRKAEEAVKDFKDEVGLLLLELDGVGKFNSVGDSKDSYKNIQDIFASRFDKKTGKRKIEGLSTDIFDDEIKARIELEKRKQEILKDSQDKQKELTKEFQESIKDLVSESINAVFETQVQNVQNEIDLNNEKYSALLDNENLTEEQRSAMEAERDRKNIELEKKKRQKEKEAFLFRQGMAIVEVAINLARSISAINAMGNLLPPIAAQAYIATNTGIAIGTAAAQAALIVAQSIPQFAEGKNANDNYEGAAIWGEKRQEVKISKDGSIEFSPNKIANHLTHVKKDDVILPDASKFISSLSDEQLYNDVHKYSIIASMQGQTNALNAMMVSKSIDRQTDKLINAIKGSKTKVNVHNNNSIGNDLKFLMRLNNSL